MQAKQIVQELGKRKKLNVFWKELEPQIYGNLKLENWQKSITSKYDQCTRAPITFPFERFISQDKHSTRTLLSVFG
jgi:hypothetical protein